MPGERSSILLTTLLSIDMDWTAIIGYVFSALTGVAGWLVGKRKRKNDFLSDLQGSINMLADENAKLLKELIAVRKENAALMLNQEQMKIEIGTLRKENEELRREIGELNSRLAGVKTITRKV